MRRTHLLIILLCALLCSARARAQDWQWCNVNAGAGIDSWPVATDKSGNVFVAGVKSGIGPAVFGATTVPAAGVSLYQCVLAKYDAAGNFLWARGTEKGNSCLISIATDPWGNAYMFGSIWSESMKIGSITLTNANYAANDVQYFLAKFDASGNVTWAHTAGNTQKYFGNMVGVAFMLGLGGMATDAGGNVYIAANFHMPIITIGSYTLTNRDASGTTDDIFIAKYDPNGNVIWAKSSGGTKNDDAYALAVTPAGDTYVAGVFGSPAMSLGSADIFNTIAGQVPFVARYNAAGNAIWGAASTGTGNEYACGLAADVSNNVYLTGGLKTNSISFAGATIANPHPGFASCYLVKFDAANSVSWYKTIGSPMPKGTAWGYAVATSQCGDVWVTGAMSRTDSVGDSAAVLPIQVDVEGHLLSQPTYSPDPLFVAAYTSSGTLVTAESLPTGGDDQVGIASDKFGNLYLCGDYDGKVSFTLSGNTFPADPDSAEFLYVTKYAPHNRDSQAVRHSDTSICLNGSALLTAAGGYTDYTWNSGQKGMTITVQDTGVYSAYSYNGCAAFSFDTFRVDGVCDCSKYFFVPNTITPNGDGLNDLFYPRSGMGGTTIAAFRVYNRWGELIFERSRIYANDAANAWDGTYQGAPPLPDVYIYVIEAVCEDGTKVNKKGSITVIR